MSIFIGCDNGISGALAAYDSETGVLDVIPMPTVSVKKAKGNRNEYDVSTIIHWLSKFESIKIVMLESAQSFPGQGIVSQFTIGKNFGIMYGLLAGLKIPYQLVAPKSWQSKMFEGVPHGKGQSKQASVLVAQRVFPNTRFVASDKSTKIHDGMTDGALIAMYGFRIFNEKN